MSKDERDSKDSNACSRVGELDNMQPPSCIHLRVHASLTPSASSNGISQVLLPESVIPSTKKSASVDEGSGIDGEIDNDPITIRKEPSGLGPLLINEGNSDNKRTSIKHDNVLPDETFQFAMSMPATQRLAMQPHDSRLKQFGEKARARLEEEKQKRPEIVVLDSFPEGQIENKNKRMRSTSGTTMRDEMSTRQKLMSAHASRTTRTSSSTSKKMHAGNLPSRSSRQTSPKSQLWTPNLTNIPIPSGDKRSAFVKLHGLPIGCNPDHIHKFFTGLTVERIFLLLNNRTAIPALDASNISFQHHGEKWLQDQNDQNPMRVLVKFQSPSFAALAVDRSGETISANQLQFLAENDTEGRESPPATFVIGVTQISKDLAASLSKLTIEALPGETLYACLSATQSMLPPNVREILWAQVHQECPMIPVDTEVRQANLLAVSSAATKSIDPMKLVGYQLLARHFNRLIELQEGLLSHPDGVVANGLWSGRETSAYSDPVARLTEEARRVLEVEMDRIDSILYQARIARSIHSHGTLPSRGETIKD